MSTCSEQGYCTCVTGYCLKFQCANCGEYTSDLHKDSTHEYTCERKSIDEILQMGKKIHDND